MSRPTRTRPSPGGESRLRNTQETLDHFLKGLTSKPEPVPAAETRPGAGVDTAQEAGRLLRESLTEGVAALIVARVSSILRAPSAERPRWDAAAKQLWWRGVVVRSFRDDAPNQSAVLDAFEKAGWPARVSAPFPAGGGLNPKRRRWQTVQSLNRGMPPRTIRFSADRSGGFRWEPVA